MGPRLLPQPGGFEAFLPLAHPSSTTAKAGPANRDPANTAAVVAGYLVDDFAGRDAEEARRPHQTMLDGLPEIVLGPVELGCCGLQLALGAVRGTESLDWVGRGRGRYDQRCRQCGHSRTGCDRPLHGSHSKRSLPPFAVFRTPAAGVASSRASRREPIRSRAVVHALIIPRCGGRSDAFGPLSAVRRLARHKENLRREPWHAGHHVAMRNTVCACDT
jgi:hypothetical protein